MINLAINGFGRIGRLAFRIALQYSKQIKLVAINTSGRINIQGWAHLLKHDTAYGLFAKEIKTNQTGFIIQGTHYPVLSQKDPSQLPWKKYDVDIVLESTGIFRDYQNAHKHLQAGAKKVIISAPAKSDDIPTYLPGVNLEKYQGENIIDAGSCTTNCAAPILKILLEKFGIQKAFLTTVHAYTNDQRIQDGSHHDLRRARAAAYNIIPTSTGATKAVIKALPELQGKLDGLSIRVPILVGSLLDLSLLLERKTTVSEINQTFQSAANSELKKIITVTNEPLVSSDIIGNPHSAIVDLERTQVIDGNFVKIIAWYDNEWASANRLVETALYLEKEVKNV